MVRKPEPVDTFTTKYGHTISLYRIGRDVRLTISSDRGYTSIPLGRGDVGRLQAALATSAKPGPKLTVVRRKTEDHERTD